MTGHLRVENLGKAYLGYRSELRRVLAWFGLQFKTLPQAWVLRGVDFSVSPGEAVAIIGANGAGKSTLLKLIARTVKPTEGSVHMEGRISAILELGLGFSPELTGCQNAHHSLSLMGFSQKAIESVLPEVESFAEIGEYFDQPVRTYSSGMQARVAFSVATAFKPELLIIDEALAVGDSYFQHKSFDRIRQYNEQGSSLLFVSHSMDSVRTLCDRVILLDRGRVLKDGLPDEVTDYYNALTAEKENAKLSIEQRREKDGWLLTRSGTGEVKLAEPLRLVDDRTGEAVAVARVGQKLRLIALTLVVKPVSRLVMGFMLRNKIGHEIWGSNTWHTKQTLGVLPEGARVKFELAFTCTLGPGSYSFSPALVSSETHLEDNFEWIDNALVFDVVNADHPFFIGSSWLDAKFEVFVQR